MQIIAITIQNMIISICDLKFEYNVEIFRLKMLGI